MKRIIAFAAVAVLLISGVAFAEEKLKLGFVDMRKALNDCKAGKDAKDKLEKGIKDKQAVLEEEKKKLEAMQEDFEKKASLLSDKAKADKQKEFQDKVQAYQKMLADAQKEVSEKEGEFTKRIIEDLRVVIGEIGKADGYTIIFEKQELNPLYAKDSLDLTAKVIEKMDARPVKKDEGK